MVFFYHHFAIMSKDKNSFSAILKRLDFFQVNPKSESKLIENFIIKYSYAK